MHGQQQQPQLNEVNQAIDAQQCPTIAPSVRHQMYDFLEKATASLKSILRSQVLLGLAKTVQVVAGKQEPQWDDAYRYAVLSSACFFQRKFSELLHLHFRDCES